MRETIAICLATYNGARFLREQLESIWAQAFSDWHLYVRDDGSTDGTAELLADFADRHPGCVTILPSTDGRLGVGGNFERTVAATEAPFVAFSDQDDIWRPDKLERAYRKMLEIEARQPSGTPAMVHADRRLIDAEGREITPSYWDSRKIDATRFGFGNAMAFTLVAGAAMLVNRPLIEKGFPLPGKFHIHDAWLELIAHSTGEVGVIEEIALDWRRHGGNASGSRTDGDSARARHPVARATRLLGNLSQYRWRYAHRFRSIEMFRAAHGDSLGSETRLKLDRFLGIRERTLPGRIVTVLFGRVGPPGLARRLVFAALSGQGRAEVR